MLRKFFENAETPEKICDICEKIVFLYPLKPSKIVCDFRKSRESEMGIHTFANF